MDMPKMRRKLQQTTSEDCLEMLRTGQYGVLGVLGANDYPYAVPMNYALLGNDGELPLICMHSARAGHKITALAANPKACLTVVDQSLVVPEKITDFFRSVIVFGTAWVEDDPQIRLDALHALGKKYCPGLDELVEADIAKSGPHCSIILMKIESMTGKQARELAKKHEG